MLNCPFCGGEAAHGTMTTSNRYTIRLNGTRTFHFINCITCGANNKGLLGYKTIEQAEEHWNKRLQSDANPIEAKSEK